MMRFFTNVLAIATLSLLVVKADQESAYKKLWEACSEMNNNQNIDAVKAAIAEGAELNRKDKSSGHTPILGALLRGKTKIFTYLLDVEGVDATIGDPNGYTPAHGAAYQGRPGVMQMLIDHGIDVNDPHPDGYVPLIRTCWGVSESHFKTFKVLVDHGVDPFMRGFNEERKSCLDMCQNDWIKEYFTNLEEKAEVEAETDPEPEL